MPLFRLSLAPSFNELSILHNTPCFSHVSLYEDTDAGTVHLKNLSIHAATSVDEALNLLFMGDTNRVIAEVSCVSEFGEFDELSLNANFYEYTLRLLWKVL